MIGTRSIASTLTVAALTLTCGGRDRPGNDPAIYFEMQSGADDPEVLHAAWRAAKKDPAAGLKYRFPIVTRDIEPGTQVRLVVGRCGGDSEPTRGQEVDLVDPHRVATSTVGPDGRVEFPPLQVTTESWTSDSGAIPHYLLCGTSIISARAYRPEVGDRLDHELIATAWINVDAEPCEP